MNFRRFQSWTGVGVLVLASATGLTASGGKQGRFNDMEQCFVHIDDFYINTSKINYAMQLGGHLQIVFGPGAASQLELSGSDADMMRGWLENGMAGSGSPQTGDHPQNHKNHGPQGDHLQGNPDNFSGHAGGGVRHQPGKSDSGPQPGGRQQDNNPRGPDGTSNGSQAREPDFDETPHAVSSGNRRHSTGTGQHFVHVGDFYFNASRIDYAMRHGDRPEIAFGSGAAGRLELTGQFAKTMRRWLEEGAVNLGRPQTGGHPQNHKNNEPDTNRRVGGPWPPHPSGDPRPSHLNRSSRLPD